MALVKLPLSFVKSPMMIGSTRKAVLYDTTAVPDAKQRMIQQYYCTRMIQRYEQDTAEINARTAEKLFVNECVSSDSPTDLGPKIFVDVRVTTNLHWQIFPDGP